MANNSVFFVVIFYSYDSDDNNVQKNSKKKILKIARSSSLKIYRSISKFWK